MSSFDLLALGKLSLQANQTQLSTVGQNISNVNTDGYTRQRVDQVSLPDRTGVIINDIERITNDFLTRQVWQNQSTYNQTQTFSNLSDSLDNLLAAESTSVSTAMDEYFKALQNVVDDPISIPNRELFIAQAQALAERFNSLDSNIEKQNEQINSQLDSYASQVSTLADRIADLNDKIRISVAAGNPTNELLDQRELLTGQLSELIGISVIDQGSEQISIFIGNGQPLVVGNDANELVSVQGDPDATQNELKLMIASDLTKVTSEVSGGMLGGLLQYRTEVLDKARDELGLIALGFTDSMNRQHQLGMDLNNELGGPLFNDINATQAQFDRIAAYSDNQSRVSTALVEIQDVSSLQATDYNLIYNGPDDITLIRNSDGKRFDIDNLDASATSANEVGQGQYYLDPNGQELSFAVDGFKVTVQTDTRLAAGDGFIVQPVRNGADEMDFVLQDGRKLALASPVRIVPASGNEGNGIATVEVTDPNADAFSNVGAAGSLNPPLEIRFNNSDPLTYTVYDMSNPDNPQVYDPGTGPMAGQTFTAGEPIVVDGYEITIRNTPEAGDRFSFDFNKDGFSDNRNALAISGLQQEKLLDGGSYQDVYGSLVERVGTRTATARIAAQANQSVLDSSIQAKSSVSGVNLDEEAAKLVQFQQAYQASAQLIRVSQTLFDSLLGSI